MPSTASIGLFPKLQGRTIAEKCWKKAVRRAKNTFLLGSLVRLPNTEVFINPTDSDCI